MGFKLFRAVFLLCLLRVTWAEAIPAPFDTGVTYSATRYVSPSGNDREGNGSLASPFASLGRALQGDTPGLRVILLAGTYGSQGNFYNLQGTAQGPIAIVGQGSVTIDSSDARVGLSFNDPKYIVVENLTIQNSTGHGMNVDDGGTYATPGEYVVIRNVRFFNNGSGENNDCLKLSGIDHAYVVDSQFSGCKIGEAIDMVGCHDGVITGNAFHDLPGTAVQAKGGSHDILIQGNRFRNVATHAINMGGSTGDESVRPPHAPFEGERIQVMSNTIENSGVSPLVFLGCNECVAANNTIVNPGRYLVRIWQGARDASIVRSRNGYVINNIFYYNGASLTGTVHIGPGTDPQTFSFGNNLFYATDGKAFESIDRGAAPSEVNSLFQQNPVFVNSPQSDFRVAANSPVQGRGRILPLGIDLVHIDGMAPDRPPDIGAYRAGAGNPPPSLLPAPTLRFPASLPVNGSLSLSYPSGYPNMGFEWAIDRTTLASNLAAPGSAFSPSANFRTSGITANLGAYALSPGRYRVQVQAVDRNGNRSPFSQAVVTLVTANFSAVRVYPNPWRSDRHPTKAVTFDGLPLNSTIKLFTVGGRWVKTLTPPIDRAVWDLTNDDGDQVASGIYMYLIKASDQVHKGKLVIIH